MATFHALRDQLLGLFEQLAPLAKVQGNEDVRLHLEKAAKDLTQGKLVVVVAGEFKQGKSQLINALVEDPDLFPVDVDIATNLVSTITYGVEERYVVVLGEHDQAGAPATERPIRREEIPDYATEQRNPKNVRRARLLAMESPNPRLQDGLVLVDTPGIGGLNAQHTSITHAFINSADVILFVSDARAPLTVDELTFVREIERLCQNIVYVVSKADATADYQTIVEDDRAKLAATLERPAEQFVVVPVSSKLKIAYLASGDPEDLEDSNFAVLDEAIWGLLEQQRGFLLLTRAVNELARGLAEIKAPLGAEREAYQGQTRKALDERKHQLMEAEERARRLEAGSSDWQSDLRYGLQGIRHDIQGRFETGFAGVRSRIEEYVDDPRLRENPEQIAGRLEADMIAIMAELGSDLGRQAGELSLRIEAASGLGMRDLDIGDLYRASTPTRLAVDRLRRPNWKQKAWHITRSSMMTSGIASAAGFMIGGPVGMALGTYGGLAIGARQGLAELRDKERAAIVRILVPFVDDSLRESRQVLTKALSDLERDMHEELKDQFKRERQSIQRTRQALEAGSKRPDDQVARRLAELESDLRRLNSIEGRLEQFATAAVKTVRITPVGGAPNKTPQPGVPADVDIGDFADE